MRVNTLIGTTLLLTLFAGAGCDGSPTGDDDPIPTDDDDTSDWPVTNDDTLAYVRTIQGVYDPAASDLTMYAHLQLNGAVQVTDDATPLPTFASTGYAPFPPATYSVQVLDALADKAEVYDTGPLTFGSGAMQTVALYGFKEYPASRGGQAAPPAPAHAVRDDNPAPPATGMMNITFFSNSVNSLFVGGIDVAVNGVGLDSALAFGNFGDADGADVPEAGGQVAVVTFDDNGDGTPDGAFYLPSHAELGACMMDIDGDGTPEPIQAPDTDGKYLAVFVDNPYWNGQPQFGPTAGAMLVYSSTCPLPDLVNFPT